MNASLDDVVLSVSEKVAMESESGSLLRGESVDRNRTGVSGARRTVPGGSRFQGTNGRACESFPAIFSSATGSRSLPQELQCPCSSELGSKQQMHIQEVAVFSHALSELFSAILVQKIRMLSRT